MAYTSRGYERNWTYDATADNFDARVGRILAGGLDLQTSLREKALAQLTSNQELETLAASRQKNASANTVMQLNTRVPDTRRPTGPMDTRGYIWVDTQGNSLGPVRSSVSRNSLRATGSSLGGRDGSAGSTGPSGGVEGGVLAGGGSGRRQQLAALSGRRPQMTERQVAAAAMSATERSMHLWRRLNPGCVEETTRLPRSTFKDHFGPKADAPEADKVDKKYFFHKTDFSEYTEVKLRLMNHIKS